MNKITVLTLSAIAFLITSCFSLKEKTQLKHQHEAQTSKEATEQAFTNSSTTTNTITIMQDSTEEKYYAEIIPVGDFQYSPQSGFKGQAISVKLWGKRQSQASAKDSSTSSTALTMQTTKDNKQQSKEFTNHAAKATARKSSAINWLWLIPIAAFLFLILRNRLAN